MSYSYPFCVKHRQCCSLACKSNNICAAFASAYVRVLVASFLASPSLSLSLKRWRTHTLNNPLRGGAWVEKQWLSLLHSQHYYILLVSLRGKAAHSIIFGVSFFSIRDATTITIVRRHFKSALIYLLMLQQRPLFF